MLKSSRYCFAILIIFGSGIAGSANAAQINLSGWNPEFVGIDAAQATLSDSQAYIDRIDLAAPDIRFEVTPHSGPQDTIAQTTSQFLLSSDAQVAINANFFAPCCQAAPEPKSLVGLSVSDGTEVSPPAFGSDDAAASLLISTANKASILPPSTMGSIDLSNVFNAVSGNLIVSNGVNVSSTTPTGAPHDPFGLDPRTDVGLSQDGRYLYLIAIDGRQPSYSAGVTTSDAADLLLTLGAYQGVNLDGGGSTALVKSDDKGGAYIINRPSGGTERYVGNNLGVFADPLSVPEPSYFTVFAAGFVGLLASAALRSRRAADRN
ncbi:MAG: phosphodiester glycosidase family protein [Chroococcidiopsidaceae cyanobacterium CP_BM_RX_35]|nr:phosphodiester glycosidase family protein [Chroococcidiopsidaceae cyanobacterium CP_BM_RX_35]